VPKAFNESGFNVLSINRVGYAQNPLPESASPVLDSIPLYSALIIKSYEEHSNGKNGIVLVGHSLCAVTSLSIAAFEGEKLPLLGVSALGIIPTKHRPAGLVDILKADLKTHGLLLRLRLKRSRHLWDRLRSLTHQSWYIQRCR
jgi:hypothetical protein